VRAGGREKAAVMTVGGDLDDILGQAREYVSCSKATNTLRAYQSDCRDFEN